MVLHIGPRYQILRTYRTCISRYGPGRAERHKDLTDTNMTGYAVLISVTERDIKPDENGNPVKRLRLRYDAWKKAARP
jgi:hypothetical protein